MKNILIDIDGVACDHAATVCRWVNDQFKIESHPQQVTTWNHNFGPITFEEVVNKCYSNQGFVQSMEVSDGFMDF